MIDLLFRAAAAVCVLVLCYLMIKPELDR